MNLQQILLAWYRLTCRGHILYTMRTPGLPLLCFQSMQFLKTNISQGSIAASLRCEGICNDIFIANFLLSVAVK